MIKPIWIREIPASVSTDAFRAWPTLARLRNGRLILTCSAGREGHVCPYGQVHCMTSDTAGEDWSEPRCLVDGPLDDRDAGVLQTPLGTILVSWFTSVAWMHELAEGHADIARPRQWERVRSQLTEQIIDRDLGAWIMRSEDGGQSWSHRIDALVGSPHGPIALSDGRLLHVGARRVEAGKRGHRGSPFTGQIGVASSDDDGKTWRWIAALPVRDGDDPSLYHEPHAVETADGRIIVLLRNHNTTGHGELRQCESHDGGHTWTTPRPTGVWGYPPHLLRLGDGRVMLTYGHRREPQGNHARISDNHGQTWSDALVLNSDSPHRDLGYPSTVELQPGQFLSVWYERRGHGALLRQARWTLDR